MTKSHRVGHLAVDGGHVVSWSESGNPTGKPAVLVHGGPGSGSSARHRRLFDPSRYRIIQFDQRNCGQSTPYAGASEVDLSANTTQHLIADLERLRTEVGIDRWLVWGASWGSTLGLAYAEAHPDSVSELVLSAVVSTNSSAVEWATRTVGQSFPEQWKAFVEHLPADQRYGNLAQAYSDLLMKPDPAIHHPAARAWCEWEEAHVSHAPGYRPNPRYADPSFRLCFARLVTHYWANAAFLDDDQLVRNAKQLGDTPTYMAHGRLDVSSPLAFPVDLAEALTNAELFIADNDGHDGPSISNWIIGVTDRLATARRE